MILVVGVGRTGTSVVSKTLEERLGVDMGGPGTNGCYEDDAFRRIGTLFWQRQITEAEWQRRAREIAESRQDPWGVKYPPHAEFMPTVLRTFPDAPVVWCVRDFWDTYESWLRRFTLEPEEAWARIQYRHWSICLNLLARPHLKIDLTDRLEEEELERGLRAGISRIKPGELT